VTWPATRRRKILLSLGAAGVLLFVFLRYLNFYGDPSRWSHQGTLVLTVMSFLIAPNIRPRCSICS
jgi:hypothetical protein